MTQPLGANAPYTSLATEESRALIQEFFPVELLLHIFECLCFKDQKNVLRVCKKWNIAATDPLLEHQKVSNVLRMTLSLPQISKISIQTNGDDNWVNFCVTNKKNLVLISKTHHLVLFDKTSNNTISIDPREALNEEEKNSGIFANDWLHFAVFLSETEFVTASTLGTIAFWKVDNQCITPIKHVQIFDQGHAIDPNNTYLKKVKVGGNRLYIKGYNKHDSTDSDFLVILDATTGNKIKHTQLDRDPLQSLCPSRQEILKIDSNNNLQQLRLNEDGNDWASVKSVSLRESFPQLSESATINITGVNDQWIVVSISNSYPVFQRTYFQVFDRQCAFVFGFSINRCHSPWLCGDYIINENDNHALDLYHIPSQTYLRELNLINLINPRCFYFIHNMLILKNELCLFIKESQDNEIKVISYLLDSPESAEANQRALENPSFHLNGYSRPRHTTRQVQRNVPPQINAPLQPIIPAQANIPPQEMYEPEETTCFCIGSALQEVLSTIFSFLQNLWQILRRA
jgi:hypothetical protein